MNSSKLEILFNENQIDFRAVDKVHNNEVKHEKFD